MQVRLKRMNPAFACIRVHTLVRSLVFTVKVCYCKSVFETNVVNE